MRKNTLFLTLATAALALTGCSSATAPSVDPTSTTAAAESAAAVTVSDAWVKAATASGGEHAGMTGLFGVVSNGTDAQRTVVKASSDAASMVQLHTTVTTAGGGTEMKEQEGGFDLPAGGQHAFEPGGDHVMLMGLKEDLEPGDTVDVTLTLDDGTEVKVSAPVKAFAGAKESYAPTGDASTPEADEHAGHEAEATDAAEAHEHATAGH